MNSSVYISLAEYILENNLKEKGVVEIFNGWKLKANLTITNSAEVLRIMKFIQDIKVTDERLLNEALKIDKAAF